MGTANHQLNYPSGLFVSDDGSIYVADTNNNRVVKWASGISTGRVLAGDGVGGSDSDRLNGVDSFGF